MPLSGRLLLFYNGAADCTVIHDDGPADHLSVTPYPDADSLPDSKHYLKEFLDARARITFEPYYIFYLGSDAYDYRDVKRLVPEELQRELAELLGCSLSDWDPSLRVFGRPLCWQGEDEVFEDDDHKPPDQREFLLFQDEFGEGNIHFRATAPASRRGNFSEAWLDYSGT